MILSVFKLCRSQPLVKAPHRYTNLSKALLDQRRMASTQGRTYSDAVAALNSLQSNAALLATIRASRPSLASVTAELQYYLRRLAVKPSDLNALNAIHITGTKGKGSTSAFVSSLLCTHAPTAKVGLYTSPHLVSVRERIRINGMPVTEEVFVKYFWQVWDKFGSDAAGEEPIDPSYPIRPAYFKFLTFVAYKLFLGQKVDATILEVGIGGLVDSTNCVPSPLVTGVCALGLDHVDVIGHTIAEIAGNKGGIFKPGVPAMSIEDQPVPGIHVFASRASERKASSFSTVPLHPALISENPISLGLKGKFQKSNASLAISLVSAFLASPRRPSVFPRLESIPLDDTAATTPNTELPPIPTHITAEGVDLTSFKPPPPLPAAIVTPEPLPQVFRKGLENARWPARCQVIQDPSSNQSSDLVWAIDGAHTVESLDCCGDWFRDTFLDNKTVDEISSRQRVLIFNCTGGRDTRSLLISLLTSIEPNDSPLRKVHKRPFDLAIFCTNVTDSAGDFKAELMSYAVDLNDVRTLSLQNELAQTWRQLNNIGSDDHSVQVVFSIQEAVARVRSLSSAGSGVDVLVTGSLHLVGGLMDSAGLHHVL